MNKNNALKRVRIYFLFLTVIAITGFFIFPKIALGVLLFNLLLFNIFTFKNKHYKDDI